VGGRPGGFDAPALVDRDIDNDRAVFHVFEIHLGDQARRFGAGRGVYRLPQ